MTLDHRLALYNQGLGDAQIARATGGKPNTVTVWRRKLGLAANPAPHVQRRLTREEAARRMLLYQLGWSDKALARNEGRSVASIREWRSSRRLPPNFATGVNQIHNPRPTMTDVHRRIRRAVRSTLGRENVDDAVADLTLALLDGTIALDEIEKQARRYGNRVLEQFASKWGPRSLDQDLTDSEGFTLLDTLADERSSSWLEEMGATVW